MRKKKFSNNYVTKFFFFFFNFFSFFSFSVIPLGLLHDAHYTQNVPKYLNVGSLGLTLAHEILHSLDQMGRGFDENGTRRVSLYAKGWKKGFLRFWGLFMYSSIIMVDHSQKWASRFYKWCTSQPISARWTIFFSFSIKSFIFQFPM